MIATLVFLAAPLLGGDLSDALESVLVRYDLSTAIPEHDEETVQESLFMRGGAKDHDEIYRTNPANLYERHDADVIVDLITRLYAEEFEYEHRAIQIQNDGTLFVFAPPSLQEKIRATLAEIQRVLSSSVRLQIDVVTLAEEGPAPFGGASVVDADQLAFLPDGQGGNRESYVVDLFAGRTSVVQRLRSIPLLVDYDVEIAQGATIADPVIGVAEEGTRFLLRASPVDGGLALAMCYLHGDALQEQPTEFEFGSNAYVAPVTGDVGGTRVSMPGTIERIEVAFRSVAINTVLPEGKALVMTSKMDMAGSQSRQAVIVRKVGGHIPQMRHFKPEGTELELVFIHGEAMSLPEFRMAMGGDGSCYLDPGAAFGLKLSAELIAENSEYAWNWVEENFSTWRALEPWFICLYDPAWDEGAVERTSALTQALASGTDLVQVTMSVKSKGHGGAAPASWTLPVRAGSAVAGVVGVASTGLVDFDVEVAQSVAVPVPMNRGVFNGLAFSATTSRTTPDSTTIEVEALAHLLRGPVSIVATGGSMIDQIEKRVYDSLQIDERVVLPAGGGTAVMGDVGGGDDGMGLEISVR